MDDPRDVVALHVVLLPMLKQLLKLEAAQNNAGPITSKDSTPRSVMTEPELAAAVADGKHVRVDTATVKAADKAALRWAKDDSACPAGLAREVRGGHH